MATHSLEFDPAEHDTPRPHVVSEENDLSLLLRSGIDSSAARGLSILLRRLHNPQYSNAEYITAAARVQADNELTGKPNEFAQLEEQLALSRKLGGVATNASGDDVLDLPPAV